MAMSPVPFISNYTHDLTSKKNTYIKPLDLLGDPCPLPFLGIHYVICRKDMEIMTKAPPLAQHDQLGYHLHGFI